MDDVRVFGRCAVCGNKITDEDGEYYVNVDGEVFCSCECVLNWYSVEKIEV